MCLEGVPVAAMTRGTADGDANRRQPGTGSRAGVGKTAMAEWLRALDFQRTARAQGEIGRSKVRVPAAAVAFVFCCFLLAARQELGPAPFATACAAPCSATAAARPVWEALACGWPPPRVGV